MPETLPGARPPRLHSRLLHLLKRVGRILGFTLLGLELLYLLAVNVVLNLPIIPKLIDGEDAGMSWSYAVSLYPGQAIVHGFFMRIQDPNIQFTLSIGEAHAHFTLGDLFHRTFHITRVDGKHAVYLMRLRRTPAEVAETDLSTLPVLKGFPAVPLRRAVEPPPGPPETPAEVAAIWTVHIEGVHVVVDEGWFEALRFTGQSAATGSFTLKPKHMVIVDGHWHVADGTFNYGHDPLFKDAHGDASVRISPFDPTVTPGNEPLRYIDGLLNLEGRLSNARFIDPVLGKTAPQFTSDEGSFELFFHFDRGRVGTGTHLRLQANNWQVGRRRYQVNASTARLDSLVSDIGGVPTSITSLDLGPYHVSRTPASGDPGGELLTGDGMVLRLISTKLDTLGPFFSDLAYEFVLHEARMSDLRRLNAYLPGTGNFEVLGGEGTISGDYISPADDDGHGSIDITANDAAIRLMRVRVGSDLAVHLDLTGVASDSERMVIVGARPIGAKGRIEGRLRIRRPDDLIAAFPTVGSSELSCDFSVDPLTVPELQKAGLLHFLSGKASLTGQFEGLGFVGGLLPKTTPVTISGGAGGFSAVGSMDHGRFGTDSRFDLHADDAQVDWGEYRARASARVTAGLHSTPQMDKARVPAMLEGKLGLKETRLEVGGETLFAADELSVSGSTTRHELGGLAFLRPSLVAKTSGARIPQLRMLNRYLPDGPMHLEGGGAALQAEVIVPSSGQGRGSLAIALEKVVVGSEDLSLLAGLHLNLKVSGLGEAPWREGLWDRTRLTSSAQLDAHAALRPGAKSQEAGLLSLEIKANGEVPPLPAGAPPKLQDVLTALTAHGTVDGEIAGIGYLNRFLGAQGLRAEGGTGTMNLSLGIEQGDIAAGSWGRVIMEGVGLKAGAFALATTAELTAVVGAQGANRLSLGLGLDHYEVHFLVPGTESKPAVDPILLRGSGLRFELRSEQLDPSELPESSMQVEMGDVLMPDLRVLNLFLPASGAALLSAGQARLTGTLEKPAHGKSKAVVKLQGTKTHVDLVGHPMLGDFHLTVNAATVIPGTGWSPPSPSTCQARVSCSTA